MEFEYDPLKSESNKSKHGIDFEDAKGIWDDDESIEVLLPFGREPRYLVVGVVKKLYWSAVITYRETTIRIISVRRSRPNEKDLYDNSERI